METVYQEYGSLITALVIFLFMLFVITVIILILLKKRQVVKGMDDYTDMSAVVKVDLAPDGQVLLLGEIWNAESLEGDIKAGERVIVKDKKGLTLFVEKIKS